MGEAGGGTTEKGLLGDAELWSAAHARVQLLATDPDLGRELEGGPLEAATRELTAPVLTLEHGPWDPEADGALGHERLGLLVADGVLMRTHAIGRIPAAELLGAGDIVRPTVGGVVSSIETSSRWQVILPARLLVLDAAFMRAAVRWPTVISALFDRMVHRARFIAFQMAISHVRRVDARIVLLFWWLAERWGRVTPQGVVVPLALTHATLGVLVGAQRPSVSTALKHLRTSGELTRREDGTWLLQGDPPDASSPDYEPLTV